MKTNLRHFDELTYPEVAALPREARLLLPLGEMAPQALAEAAGGEQAWILPALPFGWEGSGLSVPRQALSALIRNLLGNLLEDGFHNLVVCVPAAGLLDDDLPQAVIAGQGQAPPLPAEEEKEKVVLIPIGQTEQHGFHAPLNTDTVIIEAIAEGTARAAPQQAVCMPVTPYGVSTHRRSFPGTFNVGGRAFEDFWLAVVEVLVRRGFSRFYLLSGHGGNCSFLTTVVKYAGERHPTIFCATTGLYLNGPKGAAALEAKRTSAIGGMGHACELETSLMLVLRPELIDVRKAVDETDFIATPSYYMDWIEGGALIANPPWDDDTRTGAYGAGSLATKEKGEYWLQIAIEEKVDHVLEIQEQWRRRRERREETQTRM